MLTILLSSVGNPDHRQDPDQPLWGCPGPKRVVIQTLKEASAKCREYIDEYELGGGNWSGGEIQLDEKPIAYVGYGGAIWTDKKWGEESHKKIEDPDVYLEEKKAAA